MDNKINIKEETIKKVLYCVLLFALGFMISYTIYNNNSSKQNTNNNVNSSVEQTKIVSNVIEEQSDLKKAINKVYDSTIYIEVQTKSNSIFGPTTSTSSGSGFVYKKGDKEAYILTNYHVIEGGTSITVTNVDGKEADANVVSGDEYYDIAVLKVDASFVKGVAELGESSNTELGDTLFTVGAPLGKNYMGTITKGILSGKNRMVSIEITNGTYLMEVMQTDASINSGNSGGPICNINGQVIGITSSKISGTSVEGMGFAIPIDTVKTLLTDLESGKEIEKPYLGVQVVDIDNVFRLQYYSNIKVSSDVTFGAVLSYIEEGKPAALAGLKVGDVIIEMNGEKVEDTSYFRYILYKSKVGDTITVKYYRDNAINEVQVKLTEAI